MTTGVLLTNLGTPASPATGDVRRYLREFLMDGRVIDLHPVPRALLVHGIIAPFRAPKSAAAYRSIWTEAGSPLLVHSLAMASAVQERLGADFPVELSMRYGEPSARSAIGKLRARGATKIALFPLYPHYAASSYGSALEDVLTTIAADWTTLPVQVVDPFYAHPAYVRALADSVRPALAAAPDAHVLFSFHGLPERHVQRCDATGRHCLASDGCCDRVSTVNAHCYRAQAFETVRKVAALLSIAADRHSISFQSRLGRDRWLLPSTETELHALPARGVKLLVVVCPSFVADCLETLEEMGIRGRETFLQAGGESYSLVPSLNADPAWVGAAVEILRGACSWLSPKAA